MKDQTRLLGYVQNPAHNFMLSVAAFPPVVNPSYLELWAEFIRLDSVVSIYNVYSDSKVSITIVALIFINYLKSKGLTQILRVSGINTAQLTALGYLDEAKFFMADLLKFLSAKHFTQQFLISDVRLVPIVRENKLLNIYVPDTTYIYVALVSKDFSKAWNTYRDLWPKLPRKVPCEFNNFVKKPSGFVVYGDYEIALITGDILVFRVKYMPKSIVCKYKQTRYVFKSIQRKLKEMV